MRTHGRFLPPSYPMPATTAKKTFYCRIILPPPIFFRAAHAQHLFHARADTCFSLRYTTYFTCAISFFFVCHCRSTPGSLDLSRVKAQGEESPPPPPPPASQAAAALFKEEENQEQGQHGSPKKPKEEDEEEECGDKEPKEEAASSPHHALQAAEEDRVAAAAAAADNSEPENDGEKLGRGGEDGEATPEPRSDHGADAGGEDQDAAEDEN